MVGGGKKIIRLSLEYRPVKVNRSLSFSKGHPGMVTMFAFNHRATKSYGLTIVTETGTI